jgi:hypothetical protein
MKKRRALCTVILVILVCSPGFTQNQPVTVTIEPYTREEFPQWARDLRRTEIVTLGSLPFVTLSVTLGYGIIRWAGGGAFPNPFAKSADNLTSDEQLEVLLISLGTSVALGLADLTINLIRRHNTQRRQTVDGAPVIVTEIIEFPDAGDAPDEP